MLVMQKIIILVLMVGILAGVYSYATRNAEPVLVPATTDVSVLEGSLYKVDAREVVYHGERYFLYNIIATKLKNDQIIRTNWFFNPCQCVSHSVTIDTVIYDLVTRIIRPQAASNTGTGLGSTCTITSPIANDKNPAQPSARLLIRSSADDEIQSMHEAKTIGVVPDYYNPYYQGHNEPVPRHIAIMVTQKQLAQAGCLVSMIKILFLLPFLTITFL